MNYIIEDGFDFFKELNGSGNGIGDCEVNCKVSDDHTGDQNKCMISHLPLIYNSITLPCSHTFNYLPLYTELGLHNNKKNISCPYCREVSDKLIPFIPLPTVKKIVGVNYPTDKCMPAPECTVIIKLGSKKGLKCGRRGIAAHNGIFCIKHQLKEQAKEHEQLKEVKEDVWSAEMDNLSKAKSVVELKEMLKDKGLKISGVKKDLVKRLVPS
jgi:hypothetical protein